MGFKDPFKRHAYGLGSGQQLADRIVVDRSRGDVEIEHRIDRDPRRDSGVPDQIADRIGRLVEEGADLRFDTHSTLPAAFAAPFLIGASFQIRKRTARPVRGRGSSITSPPRQLERATRTKMPKLKTKSGVK